MYMIDTVLIILNISITIFNEVRKSKCTRIKSHCGCFDIDLTRRVPQEVEEVEAKPVV